MKIYLLLYNRETHKQFFKYFSSEYEKDKFKNKLRFSKKLMIIEDSTDIIYEEEYRWLLILQFAYLY